MALSNLVPEKLTYKFGDDTVEVLPLSTKQVIELSRFLSKQIVSITRTFVTEKVKAMTFGDMLDELFLSEENIKSLLVLITGRDKAFFEQNFKLSTALRLIREVFVKEGLAEVFTEKLQITQMMTKMMMG